MRLTGERRRRCLTQALFVPLLLSLLQAADCLFLHTSSAVIRSWRPPAEDASGSGGSGDGATRSLFGYRVAAVRDGADAYLLVSDPVGYHPDTNTTSGTVHICRISAGDFNTSGPICSYSGLPFNFPNPDGDVDGFVQFAQFGASLASLPDGQFAVCAPGYNFATNFSFTATPGLCAYWRSPRAQPVWLQKFFPTFLSKDERLFGHCLGGFEAALTKLSGVTRLTVSGPLCMLQRLAAVVVSGNVSSSISVVKHLNSVKPNDYLGYSLTADPDSATVFATSPLFMEKNRPKLLARFNPVSAKAHFVEGKIDYNLYDHLFKSYNYIGYSSAVISASLTERRKALVLGAPFHSEGVGPEGINRGCVFVLPLQGSDDKPPIDESAKEIPVRYCGLEPGGRLGTSVVGIGDINYDGSEDFAVGCPGCGANGTGAIYLFLGFDEYKKPPVPLEPFEVVRAPDISPLLSGFGLSLAVAADLDGNTVDELVAGAVASRHVVLLPGRLLLNTEITFRYLTSREAYMPNVSIHVFCERMSMPMEATISMRTKPGINLTSYGFNLDIGLEEVADTELQRRFEVNLLECPSSTDGWCRLSRQDGADMNTVQFMFKFRLKPLANLERHAPPDAMLRDLNLRVRWRITNRTIPHDGSNDGLFPAVVHRRRVFPSYENAFEVTLYTIKTGVCTESFLCGFVPTNNLILRLASKPSLLLNSYNPVVVTLLVQKVGAQPYYGGTALRLTLSPGIHVQDNVTLREANPGGGNSTAIHVRYWSDHREVLLTEPFPAPPDLMTRHRKGEMRVTLRLSFDSRRVSYRVNFRLVNLLGDVAGFRDYVTKDTQPTDNEATLEINFNTSLTVQLLSATDELTVADARDSASESRLLALSGTTAASIIGPGLQHAYELLSVTKPAAPVRGITLTVRVPLVTSAGQLLLYFPKNAIASHTTSGAGLVSQYLPGLPFTSDDAGGFVENKDRECRPLEFDLAPLLANPRLILLESQHGVVVGNVTLDDAVNRERREAPKFEFLVRSTEPPTPVPPPTSPPDPTTLLAVMPTFDCDRPELAPVAFRCVTFQCAIRDLGRHGTLTIDRVFLHVHARLWSPTYFKRHLSQFNIRSRVSLQMPLKDVSFRSIELAGNSSIEQTFLFLGVRPPMVDRIPWGYIILAIFLGIWLLLLLILLLWYCNFFRRKRYNNVPQNETNEDDDFYR